jgi:LMBR1-like membrane protein
MIGWFTILVMVCVFLFTVGLLYQYPSKATSIFVYFLVFIGWFASFAVVSLLPYDIYLAKKTEGYEDEKNFLHICWVIVYWTAFFLCWVILPVTEKFHTSGEFSFFSRLRNAVYRQLKSFLLILALGLGLFLYLYFGQDWSIKDFPELLVLMSNCWGLLLIIILLGYGLVSLPMTFWRKGSLIKTLEMLQMKSVPLDEAMIDSKDKLRKCVKKTLEIASKIPRGSPLRKYIEIILEKCPEFYKEQQRSTVPVEGEAIIEHKELVNLHKELKDAISENLRTQW